MKDNYNILVNGLVLLVAWWIAITSACIIGLISRIPGIITSAIRINALVSLTIIIFFVLAVLNRVIGAIGQRKK